MEVKRFECLGSFGQLFYANCIAKSWFWCEALMPGHLVSPLTVTIYLSIGLTSLIDCCLLRECFCPLFFNLLNTFTY
jgi:hypothetical protein